MADPRATKTFADKTEIVNGNQAFFAEFFTNSALGMIRRDQPTTFHRHSHRVTRPRVPDKCPDCGFDFAMNFPKEPLDAAQSAISVVVDQKPPQQCKSRGTKSRAASRDSELAVIQRATTRARLASAGTGSRYPARHSRCEAQSLRGTVTAYTVTARHSHCEAQSFSHPRPFRALSHPRPFRGHSLPYHDQPTSRQNPTWGNYPSS